MKFFKRYWGLVVFGLVALLLFAALVIGKNVFLGRVRRELGASFEYGSLRLSAFPPALVVEDVRSRAPGPVFAARRVTVSMTYLALLRREKPLRVSLEGAVLRLSEEDLRPSKTGRRPLLPLPFEIERGVAHDAELRLSLAAGVVKALGVKALFIQKRDVFRLAADIREAHFVPGFAAPAFGGRAALEIEGRGRDVTVRRLVIEGPGLVVRAGGRVGAAEAATVDGSGRYQVDTAYVAGFIGLPFDWRGEARGEFTLGLSAEGRLAFDAGFAAPGLVLSGASMGDVRGRIKLTNGPRGTVEIESRRGDEPPALVSIDIRGDRIEGTIQRAYLNPVFNWVEVPWPVSSPAWGTFSLAGDILQAQAEFRGPPEPSPGNPYPVRGRVGLTFNQKTMDLEASTVDMEAGFARVEANMKLRVDKHVEAEIRGAVADVKRTREFVSLLLPEPLTFPEIRGAGGAEVKISGDPLDPKVTAVFSVTPGGFDLWNANLVEGRFETQGEDFDGRFHVDDPAMRGDVDVRVRGEAVETDVREATGELAAVLPALRIEAPLTGRASGSFKVRQEGETVLETSGSFSSPRVSALGRELKDVRGRLLWKADGTFALSDFEASLGGARITGSAELGLVSRDFDVDLKSGAVDLSSLDPRLHGTFEIALAGKGVFGRDLLPGTIAVKDLVFSELPKSALDGTLSLDYGDDMLTVGMKAGFLPGDNPVEAKVRVPLKGEELSGEINGHFANLDLLVPWKGARGRLNYLGQLSGTLSAPLVTGAVDFQGSVLPLPRFAHTIDDFSGLVFVRNGSLSVRSFQGKLGGGDVRASGEVTIGKAGVETIDLSAEGRDMLVSPLERTRALADGTARLVKDARRFVLDGNFLIKRLLYRREVTEEFSFSSEPYQTRGEPQFFDDLSLNLRIRAAEDARMENSLGRVNGRFDLTVAGNVLDPVVLGDIVVTSGEIDFQERTFRVLKGRLSFLNPVTVEPYIDVRAETIVKNYRVTVAVTGLVTNLKPEFTSSPPLPPEDILALLAMGESFRRTYSTETSSRLGTASLLSFQIAEQAKRRAEGLFRLDSFRIDPFMMGTSAEMTARLTVGKKLARNLTFMYSTNLTAQREEIIRLEWEIGEDFSLVGIRNEWGRISLDVKLRKRF